MAIRVALMGAGGKMGGRITRNIRNLPDYEVMYVEISQDAQVEMSKHGIHTTSQEEALSKAEVVILALPDRYIGRVTQDIVPKLQPGAMVMSLDPAAAYAGVIPLREDLSYFVAHPCHTSLFNEETTDEARQDWFGGVHAAQDIVCALHQGPENDYAKGEVIARHIYAPVIDSYRVTVEQMAILEPALVETFAATLVTALKEAFDEAVKMGVPPKAAEAFLMGHLRTEIGIVFGYAGFPFSDGAKLAITQAYDKIFKPDWKAQIFTRDALKESVAQITDSL
ncbi:MAG: semialdehyde dehydrogenase [Chloroflexi bacterium AL-N5]|nr:semialdehyde dehydrogenase [Chloroflexi bacterium AL-N5]